MEGINIISSNADKPWEVRIDSVSHSFFSYQNSLDEEAKNTLKAESLEIFSKCVNPNDNREYSNTGLAIGYVQSGKTLSFTSVLALAADNDFSIAVILSGTKNNLLSQTKDRIIKDLRTNDENREKIKIVQDGTKEYDIGRFLKQRKKPLIVFVILKHYGAINELTELFQSRTLSKQLEGKSFLIIDDEADQASLNNFAKKNSKKPDFEDEETSTTYRSILELRNVLTKHSYLQYTATPQGPLLISLNDLLSPDFHKILTPGKAYVGGRHFFKDRGNRNIVKIPENEVYHNTENILTECPRSLRSALQHFIFAAIIHLYFRKGSSPFTFMVHPDRMKDDCDLFYGWIKGLLINWEDTLSNIDDPDRGSLIQELELEYNIFSKGVENPPEFNEISSKDILEILLDVSCSLLVGKNKSKYPEAVQEINWSVSGAHVVVGADLLNRGFTVEGLSFTYMPRYSKGKTISDTMQQRARFFGYKKEYFDLCRIYLPLSSITEYQEYVDDEEYIREFLKEKSLSELAQILPQTNLMNATRPNILSSSVIKSKMEGEKSFVYYDAKYSLANNKILEVFSKKYSYDLYKDYKTGFRNHGFTAISIDEAISLFQSLKFSEIGDTFRKVATIEYLRILKYKETDHCNLFRMDFETPIGEERTRSIKSINKPFRLKELFSGRSNKGEKVYPGDSKICIDDSLSIQIYKVQLDGLPNGNSKLFWTLGLIYPPHFERNFITTG